MKKPILAIFAVMALFLTGCKDQDVTKEKPSKDSETLEHTDDAGYSYRTFSNDPTGLRLYTLDNGLKVYLGENEDEPKIQTLMAVRAGSVYDPADNTGLAHYLEHMMFKGTSKIGTQDWAKEKVELQKISDLFEKHKKAKTSEAKKAIYHEIDSVSQVASTYSVANEYDKMMSSIGSEGTNAFTSTEQTVYIEKIPSNELDKFLKLQGERFGELTLRLFHTELEAVYEEFNRGQDSDGRKKYQALMEGLFPTHPYGTQTTIGESEHLKNPSMEAIHNYFDKYYVPNNMALVMVGDIDFDKTIKKVDDAFGDYEKKPVERPTFPDEKPLNGPVEKTVKGPTSESIYVGFRTKGVKTKDEKIVTLIDYILANSQAGLIDLDLNQKQKVQKASSFASFNNDYGFHVLTGRPKEGQSLDEVKELLLGEIEKVKKGEFEDWLPEAVTNDLKLSEIRQYDNATATAYAFMDAFVHHQDWQDRVDFIKDLKEIGKQDIIDYAKKHYNDNYVAVYKRKGKDTTVAKVENPGITPVQLNRDKQSDFLTAFDSIEAPSLKPQHIDYDKAIQEKELDNGLTVSYIENEDNDLFNLDFIFDMGKDNDKALTLAVGYLDYLGTEKYSPEKLKQEFYKLGIDYSVSTGRDRSYVEISGLKENLPEGLELLEHLWMNAKADQKTYDSYIESILKSRQDAKTQKGQIFYRGLMSYAKYGEDSRLRNIYSGAELKAMDPADLVEKIKDLHNFKQRIFYYGKDVDKAVAAMNTHHKVSGDLKNYPEAKTYKEKETGGHVYYTDYDMVQAEMLFLSKGDTFDPDQMAATSLFNTYFGSGLSSIVFQEIRESQSLAYSAYSTYRLASEKDKPNYVMAYVGTQANKMDQAINAMMELMQDMPEAKEQFESAKNSTLKKIASRRYTKSSVFWRYERLKKRGIDHDMRQEIYDAVKGMTMDDLKAYFNKNIKGQEYNVIVIGNKDDLDMNALQKLGEVEEQDPDYLFNYEKGDAVKM